MDLGGGDRASEDRGQFLSSKNSKAANIAEPALVRCGSLNVPVTVQAEPIRPEAEFVRITPPGSHLMTLPMSAEATEGDLGPGGFLPSL